MNQFNTWKEQIRIKEQELKEKLDDVPKIHWEILSYSNTHTKEEVLQQYPEHKEFINSITFNS